MILNNQYFKKKEKHTPDTAVLAANSSILAGGVYTHVVEGGLPYHMVRASKLGASVSLAPHRQMRVIRING